MGIRVPKACVRAACWLILQRGWCWEPGLLSTHLQHGGQHLIIIYATEVCWIYCCSPLKTQKTTSIQQHPHKKRDWLIIVCRSTLTSSGRSSSSWRQLLSRLLRLACTFLVGSSSQSESRRIEVQLELAAFPPILLHTVIHSEIIFSFLSRNMTE